AGPSRSEGMVGSGRGGIVLASRPRLRENTFGTSHLGGAPVAKNGFKIADSDMHVLEPPDLWQRYIDPAWKHVAPVGLTELRRDMRVKVKSHVMLRIGPARPLSGGQSPAWSSDQDRVYAAAEARGWDATSQRDAMDAEGLDVAVLFPSRGLFVLGLDSPQV